MSLYTLNLGANLLGLITGELLVSNTGSHNRFSYALIGDTVNLGLRIQDLTKEYESRKRKNNMVR